VSSPEHQPPTPKTAPPQRGALIVLSLILILGVLLIGAEMVNQVAGLTAARTALPPTNTPDLVVSAFIIPIEPPLVLNDFTLTRDDGTPIRLWDDLAGKYTLVYFGYTNCPDYCPLTLAKFLRVKSLLGEQADQFNFVLISVDPYRDTPQVIRAYLDQFDEAFIGFQGAPDVFEQIEGDYGLSLNVPPPDSTPMPHNMEGMEMLSTPMTAVDGGYLVDHSAYSYLIDPEGRLRVIFGYETTFEEMLAEIERVMADG
jgi:protein SCO1/2